jgi:hypothetical protein
MFVEHMEFFDMIWSFGKQEKKSVKTLNQNTNINQKKTYWIMIKFNISMCSNFILKTDIHHI